MDYMPFYRTCVNQSCQMANQERGYADRICLNCGHQLVKLPRTSAVSNTYRPSNPDPQYYHQQGSLVSNNPFGPDSRPSNINPFITTMNAPNAMPLQSSYSPMPQQQSQRIPVTSADFGTIGTQYSSFGQPQRHAPNTEPMFEFGKDSSVSDFTPPQSIQNSNQSFGFLADSGRGGTVPRAFGHQQVDMQGPTVSRFTNNPYGANVEGSARDHSIDASMYQYPRSSAPQHNFGVFNPQSRVQDNHERPVSFKEGKRGRKRKASNTEEAPTAQSRTKKQGGRGKEGQRFVRDQNTSTPKSTPSGPTVPKDLGSRSANPVRTLRWCYKCHRPNHSTEVCKGGTNSYIFAVGIYIKSLPGLCVNTPPTTLEELLGHIILGSQSVNGVKNFVQKRDQAQLDAETYINNSPQLRARYADLPSRIEILRSATHQCNKIAYDFVVSYSASIRKAWTRVIDHYLLQDRQTRQVELSIPTDMRSKTREEQLVHCITLLQDRRNRGFPQMVVDPADVQNLKSQALLAAKTYREKMISAFRTYAPTDLSKDLLCGTSFANMPWFMLQPVVRNEPEFMPVIDYPLEETVFQLQPVQIPDSLKFKFPQISPQNLGNSQADQSTKKKDDVESGPRADDEDKVLYAGKSAGRTQHPTASRAQLQDDKTLDGNALPSDLKELRQSLEDSSEDEVMEEEGGTSVHKPIMNPRVDPKPDNDIMDVSTTDVGTDHAPAQAGS